jgi:hypothetical protein
MGGGATIGTGGGQFFPHLAKMEVWLGSNVKTSHQVGSNQNFRWQEDWSWWTFSRNSWLIFTDAIINRYAKKQDRRLCSVGKLNNRRRIAISFYTDFGCTAKHHCKLKDKIRTNVLRIKRIEHAGKKSERHLQNSGALQKTFRREAMDTVPPHIGLTLSNCFRRAC